MKPEYRVTLGLSIIFCLLLIILTMEFINSTKQVMTDQTTKIINTED